MPTPAPVIDVRSVDKSYFLGKEEIPVLHDINLTIGQGEYLAIMGQSGAGKSTLLNILGCLDTPTRGTYLLSGTAVDTMNENQLALIRNREIGFIFQNFNLLPKLTVEANVELPLIYANISRARRRTMVAQILQKFGLYERRHHRPNEISGGQKQRTAIARALVKSPAIILADEPTGNLDSKTTGDILDIIDELHSEGNTIICITHEHDVALKAQKQIAITDGRLQDRLVGL